MHIWSERPQANSPKVAFFVNSLMCAFNVNTPKQNVKYLTLIICL